MSCANETSIRYWDIQTPDPTPVVSILGAHSDNIKKIQFLPSNSNLFVSGSSDSFIKLWDLRNTSESVSSLKLQNQVEDFCFRKDQLVVANGNAITLVDLENQESKLAYVEKTSFYPFQKPALRVRYDAHRDRIIAGGLDS